MVKIKICGITTEEEIRYINEAAPDYIGFVFAESRRRIDKSRAARLKSLLDADIKTVGVFVNQEQEFIEELCCENIIDLVQLHGDEDDELKFSKPVIKAVRVRDSRDIMPIQADYALFDAYAGEEKRGGAGISFDWELVKGYDKPFFLAGGLNAGNVERAVKAVSPFCVDVSSGVETDGKKDRNKILEFVNIVRSLNDYE